MPKITFVSSDGVDALRPIAEEFMRRIFAFEPEDYLITDESCLSDCVSLKDDPGRAMEELKERIKHTYHIECVPNNLLALFREIHRQGTMQ